jgi:hypothetical protein
MIMKAPPEQRQKIHGIRWRDIFIYICDDRTIREAIADLGLDQTEANEWIAAETSFSIPAAPAPPPPELQPWARLISFRPPASVQWQMRAHGFSIHRLEDAWGPISLDYYPVTVSLPAGMTAEDLLETMRRDINRFFVDPNICKFHAYDEQFRKKWLSQDPVGAVISIDMFAAILGPRLNIDDGSVVCSEATSDHWIFSTVWTWDDFHHPVSGNRQFGFTKNSDGTATFYTRGADRLTTMLDAGAEWATGQAFTSAGKLWETWQRGIEAQVVALRGTARVGPSTSHRYVWNEVKQLYYAKTEDWLPPLGNPPFH